MFEPPHEINGKTPLVVVDEVVLRQDVAILVVPRRTRKFIHDPGIEIVFSGKQPIAILRNQPGKRVSNKGKLEVAVELLLCRQTVANVVQGSQVRRGRLEFALVVRVEWQGTRRRLRPPGVEEPGDARTRNFGNVNENALMVMGDQVSILARAPTSAGRDGLVAGFQPVFSANRLVRCPGLIFGLGGTGCASACPGIAVQNGTGVASGTRKFSVDRALEAYPISMVADFTP